MFTYLLAVLAVANAPSLQSDDRPRLSPAEEAHLSEATVEDGSELGFELRHIRNRSGHAVPAPASEVTRSYYWLRRVFDVGSCPEQAAVRWDGSTHTNRMGTWEHVNGVFRLQGRRAWWADGFTDEDPGAVNPFWLWVELLPGEFDMTEEASVHASVKDFVRNTFRLYDEAQPVQARTYYDGTKDAMGYWVLGIKQDVPQTLPSPCGWMDRMAVTTNGRHLFISVMYCTDSTFQWRKGIDYFCAGSEGYRSRSRFTGEPLKYHQALTNPKYSETGGGG